MATATVKIIIFISAFWLRMPSMILMLYCRYYVYYPGMYFIFYCFESVTGRTHLLLISALLTVYVTLPRES